jgi:uncharacterized protein YndB with AHSA1/START domain
VTTTSKRRATVTLLSDTEVLIRREFQAPRPLLFEALTRPEHVTRWYGLPHLELPVCEIDFRVGGRWRYVLRDPRDGAEHAFSGEYLEIVRPEKIVSTERYEAIPGSDYVATVTLVEDGATTTLTSHLKYQNVHHRDGHLQSGMEGGMQITYDRLDDLLAELVSR